jgi:uncharacterized membrane protein YoaK (UPF0700 family)
MTGSTTARGPTSDRPDTPSAAIILSGVGGGVDGLGYTVLGGLFTAHITGNTVKVGAAAAALDPGRAATDAFPIAIFVVAVFSGAVLRDFLVGRVSRPRVVVLAASMSLLGAFLVAGALLGGGRAPAGGTRSFYLLAALATASMGVQNAAKPVLGGRPVRTFMTGTMVAFGDALAAGATARGGARREPLRRAALLFVTWLAYLAGAAVCAAAALRLGTSAAVLPATGLAVAVALEVLTVVQDGATGDRSGPDGSHA